VRRVGWYSLDDLPAISTPTVDILDAIRAR
jgi:hypothetical protein